MAERPDTNSTEAVWVRKRIDAAAKDGTPAGPLLTAAAIRNEAEAEVARAVADLRADGYSWVTVGRLLHVSKQAAQQRYGRKATAQQPTALPPVLDGLDS